MADFAKILASLRKEEKQLEKRAAQVRNAIEALSEVPIPLAKKVRRKTAKKKAGRKKMTAAQKKAISKRMRKVWAEKKAVKKKSGKS